MVGGKGHTEKVVLHMISDFLGKGHSVYMDNFYNSYTLASKLFAKKTYCTGTLRTNRKFVPVEVKNAHLKKSETIQRYGHSIMVGKWRDKRTVLYLSNEHKNTIGGFH